MTYANVPEPLLVRRSSYWWQCADCQEEAPAKSRSGAIAAGKVHWYWTHGEGKK